MGFLGHKSWREREWEEVRSSAQDDLVALGDDIRSLDIDIGLPTASEEAKQRYGQVLEAYERASWSMDTRPTAETRPGHHGPWAGGYFNGGGGLLPTLLVGSALGAGLGRGADMVGGLSDDDDGGGCSGGWADSLR